MRLLEQPLSGLEVAAQALDAGELGQHLGTCSAVRLGREQLAEPALGRVEIVEVPERPQSIGHDSKA